MQPAVLAALPFPLSCSLFKAHVFREQLCLCLHFSMFDAGVATRVNVVYQLWSGNVPSTPPAMGHTLLYGR